MTTPVTGAMAGSGPDLTPQREQQLRKASVKLEATFLAEMLKSAGLGKARGEFGGGAGEDQYSSLLANLQAEEMARAGGIGLAEQIFESLKERDLG
ncbi:MAG: rod-binding protein [Pseudomonadota bacterium]